MAPALQGTGMEGCLFPGGECHSLRKSDGPGRVAKSLSRVSERRAVFLQDRALVRDIRIILCGAAGNVWSSRRGFMGNSRQVRRERGEALRGGSVERIAAQIDAPLTISA